MKHIHILGICGTFMGSLAIIARELGYTVTGADANVYPPMSDVLSNAGIDLVEGYDPEQIDDKPDVFVIGNTLSRGNPCLEAILDRGLAYTSGPQWLAQNVLKDKHVLAVSGTHGKTTTTSMLAWILESAGYNPGFLIGGVAENFGKTARLGGAGYFVIEADEYDTAFFDKRSKFMHYSPRTLIINNIEFDHADIFNDLKEIQRQFHHLIRLIPSKGKIIAKEKDKNIQQVLEMGCWSEMESFGEQSSKWSVRHTPTDYSQFSVLHNGTEIGRVNWDLIGVHNAENALAAIVAAKHIGINPEAACHALTSFKNVKRRLERLALIKGITVYDDFAHHPTAIRTTLQALRNKVGNERIITILEPRSNTMKMGIHKETLAASLSLSDQVVLYQSADVHWDLTKICHELPDKARVLNRTESIIEDIIKNTQVDDHVVIMSNGGFENIHKRLISRLERD